MRLLVAALLLALHLARGQEFQCTLEKIDSGEQCVFRDVNLRKNTAEARFTYPADIAKTSQVAFVDSNMKQLPTDFLAKAGPELKVLRVENCGLESVTIPSGLAELYAKGNSIEEVVVQQSGSGVSLRTLDLSGNQLSDVSNVTRCQALEELNLSGNKLGDVLDLGKFRGLNNLRKLDLTHNDVNYLDNTGNVNLESLEDLDLSHNNILPSDLNIAIFYPYSNLHTLRLNDNFMAQLEFHYFLNIKSLKTVYLNGNNFKCVYLDFMLNHLQQNAIQTPPGEPTCCPEKTFNDFCCTGPLPTKPTPSTTKPTSTFEPAEPQKRTTMEQSYVSPPERKEAENDGSMPSWMWIVVGAGIGVVVVIPVIFGAMVWKNKHKKGSMYQVPQEIY